jgi:glucose/arabinose dehydrogenase
LGIALHPKFDRNHYLYVFYTNASPLEHRVVRFTVTRNRCRNRKSIVSGLNADSGGYHNGGQLEFVGGKLFVSTGEAHEPALAQDTNSRLGKILRLNPNGSVPDGNPFGNDNPVWSYGHRNPFGLAHKPGTNKIYVTENGPNCDDEVNFIKKGRNYGWGSNYECGTAGVGPNPKAPLRRYSDIIVPTDPWFYKGKLRKLNGSLYFGDHAAGRIHRLILNAKGNRVRDERVIHDAGSGITDVSMGPGKWMYFLTGDSIQRIVKK